MARFELSECNHAVLGEGPVNASTLFDLGMMYSVGRSVPMDYITAHKWFNLAAMQGNREAARLRQEIAEQMSNAEIAAAQRAARSWLQAA
jgi:TPR repeat protein